MIWYSFASNEDGFIFSNTTYEAGQGNPPGCLKMTILPRCEATSPVEPDTVVSDGSLKFNYRFINCEDVNPLFDIVRIHLDGGRVETLPITATADSGWLLYTLDLSAEAGTDISQIALNTTGSSTPSAGYVLIDNVYLGTITGGPGGLPDYALTHSAGGVPGSVLI